MIGPLVAAWVVAQLNPATAGVTGLTLAVTDWLLYQLAVAHTEAGHTPARVARAVIADARARRGQPRHRQWADLWAGSLIDHRETSRP